MTIRAIKIWTGMTITTLAGIIGARYAPASPFLLPEEIFYVLLLVHTYLSISLFSGIEMRKPDQFMIDVLLIFSYIGLGLSLGTALPFLFANVCLFILAPIKYAFLLGRIPHEKLLRRKILVDLSGTVLAAAVLGMALFDNALIAIWTLTVCFALASVRYLYMHPLYKLQQ